MEIRIMLRLFSYWLKTKTVVKYMTQNLQEKVLTCL